MAFPKLTQQKITQANKRIEKRQNSSEHNVWPHQTRPQIMGPPIKPPPFFFSFFHIPSLTNCIESCLFNCCRWSRT